MQDMLFKVAYKGVTSTWYGNVSASASQNMYIDWLIRVPNVRAFRSDNRNIRPSSVYCDANCYH